MTGRQACCRRCAWAGEAAGQRRTGRWHTPRVGATLHAGFPGSPLRLFWRGKPKREARARIASSGREAAAGGGGGRRGGRGAGGAASAQAE